MKNDEIIKIHREICRYLNIPYCKIKTEYFPYKKQVALYNGYPPTIILNTANLPRDNISYQIAIAHETMHHAQVVRGDSSMVEGFVYWKGIKEENFQDKPYKDLPWEAEAYAFEKEWIEFKIDDKKGINYKGY